MLLRLNAWLSVSPTWRLPNETGAIALAVAQLNSVPVVTIVWVPSPVRPRPSMPLPSEASWTVTVPVCTPAAPEFRPTRMSLLPPAASPKTTPIALAAPVVPATLAASASV